MKLLERCFPKYHPEKHNQHVDVHCKKMNKKVLSRGYVLIRVSELRDIKNCANFSTYKTIEKWQKMTECLNRNVQKTLLEATLVTVRSFR